MVQFGEDPGFDKKGLHILGVGDSVRVWHLDRDRAIEVVVVSKIDPSEPPLTEPLDDPVAPDLGGDRRPRGRSNQDGCLSPSVSAGLVV